MCGGEKMQCQFQLYLQGLLQEQISSVYFKLALAWCKIYEQTWINFPGWGSGSSGDCRKGLLVEGCSTGLPLQLFH